MSTTATTPDEIRSTLLAMPPADAVALIDEIRRKISKPGRPVVWNFGSAPIGAKWWVRWNRVAAARAAMHRAPCTFDVQSDGEGGIWIVKTGVRELKKRHVLAEAAALEGGAS